MKIIVVRACVVSRGIWGIFRRNKSSAKSFRVSPATLEPVASASLSFEPDININNSNTIERETGLVRPSRKAPSNSCCRAQIVFVFIFLHIIHGNEVWSLLGNTLIVFEQMICHSKVCPNEGLSYAKTETG